MPVSRIKQIMDCHVDAAVAPLVSDWLAIERVMGWLEDEASRSAYRRELAFMVLRGLLRDDAAAVRLAGNVSQAEWDAALAKAAELRAAGRLPALDYPPSPDWVLPYMYASTFVLEQYAHGDRVRPTGTALDCGACCGETALWAAGRGAERVYAFEPNPEAFPYLERNAAAFGGGRVVPVRRALGDAPALVAMRRDDGNIGGARLDPAASAGDAVPVVTLDGWCRENGVRPDFIKMDLEGWETAALRGARETIRTHRPRLAVCLYHNLSDMWTIPALIREICPDYRFWCRKNAIMVEFVLYGAI